MTNWTTGDIYLGRMFVSGPQIARFCPGCNSPNVEVTGKDQIRCADCGAKYGGASARA